MNRLLEIGLANAASATALALLAALVGRCARRPALGHTLWMLVLLKLITPPIWGLPVGWASATEPASPTEARPARDIMPIAKAEPPALAIDPDVAAEVGPRPAPVEVEPMTAPPTARAEIPRRDWRPWLAGVWLAGSVLYFATAIGRVLRFHRLLAHAEPAPDDLQRRSDALAGQLGLGEGPGVWVVPASVSPLLWTFGGPARLVLPTKLLGRLKPEEQETILAHELAHLSRGDHWVRWLELVAVGLYWWHPAAWWARRELGRQEEQCCDAMVVGWRPDAALSYAKALLKTVDFLSEARPALPPSASGAGHVRTLKGRVTMILRGASDHRLGWPARLGALALGLLVLPAGPRPLEARLIQAPGDDAPPGADRRSPDDFERRLRQLEEKIDRLADSLGSSRRDRRSADARPRREARPRPEREATRPTEPGREKGPEDEFKLQFDEKKLEQMARDIEESVKKSIDPEKLEKMAKEIEESVKKSIDPEKIERMAKQIEESVKEAIDPKKFEEMAKEIEESVKKGIDPEKLGKLKEEADRVAREHSERGGLFAERAKEQAERARERAERDRERVKEQAERARERAKEQAERARERAERSAREAKERAERAASRPERPEPDRPEGPRARPAPDRDTRDLDRRLRQLEEKLDRILEAQGRGRSPDEGNL